MVSKNNFKNKMEQTAARTPHYGIRKLSVGVASVLISTTLYMGATTAKADTLPSTATDAATTKPETASSSSSTQDNTTVDKTAKTTVPATASFTDTSVSTTPNAQASTTNTIAGATSSDKSGANNNSLVANNVESTTNTTAQTQPKPNVVTSNKANVDNQVGSNVENKATTTTDTISAPTTPKRVVRRVRSLAAAPTTNSKELVENQDYTVSNVSLEDHKKQDNFDEDATFLHADIKAKNGDVIANKEITFRFDLSKFGEFWNFKNQDLIYNSQVIGKITGVSDQNRVFKVAFNDNTRGLKDIDLSLKIYLSANPYKLGNLYTSNKAKNNEKYTVRHNYQIGSTNYYVDREATIHYWSESEPTTQTTEQFGKPISFWYAPQEWIQLDLTYYTTRDGKTYAQIGGIPGKEISYDLGLGKGFITPDTKSVTISFEPSSKYYSKDANKLEISDNATFSEQTVTYQTKYDKNDLVAGFTDVYTTMPKNVDKVSDKHTYYVKDLIKLDGNTLIATDATTSTGLNNLSSRGGAGNNGYVGSNDAHYTVVSSDDLRKFVIDNVSKIIETRGEFLKSNSDYSNPGRIVAHNNTTGQDVYYELHNKVRVNNRDVTTPPDGTILISAGKDIPTKVYSYTSTDIPSNVDKSKLTKEVTRTINVHNPNGTVDTTVQKVTYHQTVTVAGNEVIYNNDWTTADDTNWSEFDVPQIANYRASKDKVYGQWIGGVNTQNETVDITYTATQVKETVNGSWTLKYTDKMTGEEIMPATTIHAQFTRTNTPATNTYGDWTYVPNSFSQTGTHINFTGDPQKSDNFDNGNFDNFTFNLGLPAAPNSNYNQAYSNFAITFQLRNNSDQPDTMEKTSSVPYDKVSVKQESQTRTLTEHYVYADGDKKGQKIADDAVVEIFYSREVKSINDQVVSTSEWKLDTTKGDEATPGYHVVSGTWTNLPTTWSVVSVSAPTIQGYTTDTNETENNPGHVSSLRWVFPTQSGDLNDTFMPGNKHTYEYQPEHTTYYHANDQSIKINYVDDEKGGATVKSDTLNGKTDQTVKTGITIPENYSVVGTTPSEYTFKANGNTDITVHLKHVIDTTSEEKTVTRTIKVTDPTGKVTTIPQTTKVTRTVSTDKVTNQKTYGDWTTSSFDSYDVPTIEGYTASQSKVDEAIVDGNSKDSEINISYTANDQAIKINYIDSDNNDSVVKSDTLNGKTDQTVKTGITIPEGYTIGEQVPTDYTFKASDNTDITVKLKHGTTTVTPDKPKTTGDKLPDNPAKSYPEGVGQNDLNKTVTRTIKVTDSQGKVTTETQTVHLTRTATVDEVTGNVTYSDWSTGSFDSYDVPEIEGYTATQSKVDTAKVTSDTQNSEVNVTYTANPQSIKVNYVDSDNNDSVVKSDTLSGKTDQTVKTGITIPDGYVVEGSVPNDYTFKAKDNTDITVKLKHGTTTVTANNPKTINDKLPDNPTKSYPEGVGQNDLNKTVTRTIKVTTPDGKTTTTIQTVHLTRTATVDEVTGKVTYGDWSTGSFDSYDVPSVEGYTASQDKVDTATVTSDTQNSEVNITYTANPQSIKVNYVDSDNGGAMVKSEALSGKTDETVKTNITIPDGYVVEGNVPNDYTFKAKDNVDITIKLKHGTTTVTPDNPKTVADKLPDNPNKNYPSGVAENDLNKDVTRTIKVTDPTGKVTTTTQTVHLTRTATVDEVTGKVTYGDWTTGSFDSYDVPSVEGYTATQSKVDTAKVTSDTQNSEVNISYTANPQSIKINYVDDDKGGATVKSDTLNGKTDETVKTGITIPENYTVVGTAPSDYTFKAKDNAAITVHLKHVIDTKSEEKTITRTIKVTNPNGGVMTIPQSAKSTRTVSTDKVTGEVTYGDWSKATLDGYDVPLIEGYTASQSSVATTTVDGSSEDNVVEINYTPNKQVISIDYVDNGKVISTQVLTGKTDETVKTNIQSPDKDKYVVVGDNPESYTFKAKDNEDVRVEVKHVINDSTESKDVTRTIVVTSPDGKETTKVQKATVSRTVHTDAVTGAKTYDEWSKATLDKYNVPTVDGYTPSLNVVEGLEVDGNNEDSVVKVGYTANPQSIKVNYVDEDNGSSTVKTETLNGKTDQTVKTGIEIPDGYVVEGQVPTDYTFKAKDNADITVKLKHGTTTVTADNPKTTDDKLPDNPSKSYPSGVGQNDLNKDVTRTIKVTDPTGKVTTETQTVHLTRNATVDEVTGNVTYGDWTTGSFDSYDVPSVEGYTASQDKVERTPVTADSTNSEVNISYTANDQSIKINYVDNNGGTTVKSDTLNGKTDQTVKTGITIPDGYVVDGNVPTDYTFKAKDNADITVHLTHNNVTVTADNPKTTNDKLPDNPNKTYPEGVAESDLNKDVTRTIKVTDPTGKVTTTTQTVHLTRTATVDEVTGKVTYGDWTTGSFDSYDVPSVEGYTASQDKVDTDKVTSDSTNSEVNTSYTANDQTAKVVYVDEDNGGSTVKTDILNGKTDETVETGVKVPDGYVVDGQVPADYTFKAKDNADVTVKLKHGTTTVTPDKPKTANDKLPDNPTKSYPEGVAESDLNKNVTRTIKVTDPTGKVTTTTQTVHLTRTATVDEVTGKVTYGDWTTGSFDSYDVPSVEGYTASQDKVDTDKVTSDSTNSEVNTSYTANDQTAKVVYVDEDNGGSTVKTDILNGKTDETVETGVKVPDGYVVDGQVPADYTFKAKDNADVTVKLKHGTTTVTPDKPKTANDKLPDNPTKSYPEGVAESDLNKNVTRTIKVTDPTGKVTTETQTVHLTRTATVDEVTGKVSYDDWSTGSFGSYDVPSVDGYTASQVKVDETKVTSDTQNSEVNISYTANNQTAKVVYIDGDNGGSTVKTDILKGKTDETVKTGIKVPDGYVVESNVPTDYTFKSKDNADITVKLKHGTTTVTPDKPKTTNDKLPDNPSKSYPSGVAENDLNKTVTRTIKATDPKGKVTTTTQTVHLTRTATVDEVTGKVSYGDWTTGSFDSYVVPSVEGYTASQAKVDEAKVTADSKNSEVNITYTANNQSAKIVYVDRDNGDSIVKTDTLNGKTDQTVKTGIETPDGYVVEGQVPTDYTFKAKDNADITVHLTHNKATVTPDKPKTTADKLPNNPTKSYPDGVGQNDLNKTVTRTIKVTTPDGKTSTTTQTVHLTRTATVDEVTGKVTYSDWTTGSFDSYDVPSVDGYTASQSKVDETPVTADSSNNEVNISYTANDQSAKIVYVDNGKVVSTQVLTGKTDQTVKTNIQSPDKNKYVVVGDNPENYTFKAKDNEDVRVEVKHVVNTFKDYKNVIRNIEVTYPNGKTEKLAQVTTLERTVYKDAVTGEETYSDWSNGGWDSFKAPEIKGYTADKDVKETVVTGDTTETTVSIVYTANEQATKIVYVDNDKSGSIVKTDTLNGKTDQTVKTDVKVPDGYVLEGNVPDNYTFTAGDNFDIIVHLRHGIVKVTPDKPKTTADKLPDSSKTYPEGVGQDDLNKTITRTIKVTTPDEKTSTTTQTAHLIRTARVDETTGQVTYDDWTTGSFDSYDVPSVDGYTASQAKVEETKVTSDSQDSEVNISYTANKQSIKVVYVDGDNSGSTVKTDTLTGKTDETVKTGIEIPDGYEVDGQVPSEYSFKAKDNADITVHLKHSTVTVIPDLPKTTDDKLPNNPTKSYPKGVAKDDLNKTVVRTIKVTTPDGKTTTTRQTVDLNRVAIVDEVTGQVTYSKWSIGELDRYDVPSIEGYTPSQDRVNMEVATSETKDSVVEISYTPNGQSINITYVDDDKGETTVDSYILAGKTDETVKTGIKIPDGYEIEGKVPTDYTFKAKDNTDITVRLKHKLDKGTETKTVSRIVEITLPDGQTKTIKQEQTLKRSKTTDLVTGDVVYGEWSKAEFDEVVAPEVDGYKPSQAKVEKETVDGNSSDRVVKITYKKVKSDVKVESKPTVEAKHEAKVQVAPKVEAKASAKPQAKAQPKFVTTELPQTGEKQSKGTTIGAILVGLGSLLGLGALGKRKEK